MYRLRLTIISLLLPIMASAQFFVTGDDPGKLRWNYIDTESYRIIYPQGSDSLAKVYGRKLEKYKVPVSRTSGYITLPQYQGTDRAGGAGKGIVDGSRAVQFR